MLQKNSFRKRTSIFRNILVCTTWKTKPLYWVSHLHITGKHFTVAWQKKHHWCRFPGLQAGVWYSHLISKLSPFNMSHQSLSLFQSYLHCWEQCLVIAHVKSIPCEVKTGTILAPILLTVACLWMRFLKCLSEDHLQINTVVYVLVKTLQLSAAHWLKVWRKFSNWSNETF